MSKVDPFEEVEAARLRCRLLFQIVESARIRALDNPTSDFAIALRLFEVGEKKGDASKKLARAFDELYGLIAHLTIIDMTASLEKAVSGRLKNAIGAARKTLQERKYQPGTFHEVRDAFVRDADDFLGLKGIEALVSSSLSKEVKDTLMAVREERNKFAHGTNVTDAPLVEADAAYEALKAVAAIVFQ